MRLNYREHNDAPERSPLRADVYLALLHVLV